MMRHLFSLLLVTAPAVIASQNVFSVHDDVLAFPQYEVIFSDAYVTEAEASLIIEQASSPSSSSATPSQSSSKAIESTKGKQTPPSGFSYDFDPEHNTYEVLKLHGEKHLCTIPVVETPPRNETSEAEARAAEKKELARASDRGGALLKDLEGRCLFFVSGWWSYSFCYNSEITQFHQLPPQAGKDPTPDPTTAKYVLGRAKGKPNRHDAWGNEIELRNAKTVEPPKTELQVKGDTRYLVQKMEGGTICDLTGKARRVEVQYHCSAHLPDRIGYIKEVTTCSYLLVVYTARLCNDVAFIPPKETKANSIVCRAIVPEEDLQRRYEIRDRAAELEAAEPKETLANVGGVLVGAGKYLSKEAKRMLAPKTFDQIKNKRPTMILAKAKPKAEGGQVESVSDADLVKMDVDVKTVATLKRELKKAAKDLGWRIELYAEPGNNIRVVGIIDDPAEDKAKTDAKDQKEQKEPNEQQDEEGEQSEEGSQEVFKDEL